MDEYSLMLFFKAQLHKQRGKSEGGQRWLGKAFWIYTDKEG